MITIEIPGRKTLELRHLVLDYNGTIAKDGTLLKGIEERLQALSKALEIRILTADTYGTVCAQCEALPVTICTFPGADAGGHKADIVTELGTGVACMGNGFNDIKMFGQADLSIAVLDREGMCPGLLAHADVLVASPLFGLDLLLRPDRLRATLRS